MEISTSQFAGPLPHPDILAGYEAVCPGAALRIIEMAEQQGNHRRSIECKTIDAQTEAMRRQFTEARIGQILAFGIAAMFLGCGTYIVVIGQPWAGAFFGSIGVGGIVTTFIVGRKDTQREESGDAPPAGQNRPSQRQLQPPKSKK